MSVVTGRALPDVRDGLKPVQRRILYTMYHDSNLTFDRKAAKCAQIVGDVMGNYHPHGDGAIYEAMVRLSQDWVMRVPLVHGEGNFGSVDGDPPAAYRYTEAKLTQVAESLLSRTRPGDGRTPRQLRRQPPRAGRAAGAVPEPARERHVGHRRRHGDEHPAAQPRRSAAGLHPPHREPGRDGRRNCSTA